MSSKTQEEATKIGWITIWAIGVGATLGGDFFGWQFVLYGGFASAMVAVTCAASFYWLYAGMITEMAIRYETSGGAFSFVTRALGPYAGAIMAILGLWKLVLANAANALTISSYLESAGMPIKYQLLSWISTYSFFTYMDCLGIKQSDFVQIGVTCLCLVLVGFYMITAFEIFDINNLITPGVPHVAGKYTLSEFMDGGLYGLFMSMPFGILLFDGFEDIPLLMSYADNPEVTIPKSIKVGYFTVLAIALSIIVAGAGSASSAVLLESEAPLMTAINAVYGNPESTAWWSHIPTIMACLIVLGLLINFFAFTVFVSQQIQAVAEAGALPQILAYRHPTRETPIYASLLSCVFGIALTAGFAYIFGEEKAQNILITAGLLPSMLGYILLTLCVVHLHKIDNTIARMTDLPRKRIFLIRKSYELGFAPGVMRFRLSIVGARITHLLASLVLVGLVVLATYSSDFLLGMLIIIGLSFLSYLVMHKNITENLDLAEEMTDDPNLYEMYPTETSRLTTDTRNSYRDSTAASNRDSTGSVLTDHGFSISTYGKHGHHRGNTVSDMDQFDEDDVHNYLGSDAYVADYLNDLKDSRW